VSAPLRLGTRGSALATAQSGHVAAAVTQLTGAEVELVTITTHGDTSTASLAQIGGTGVFVSALRDAVLDGRVDLAVHSLKDLPTAAAEGLALAVVPLRDDPRDALVARDRMTLLDLPAGSRIGTGSPRRAAQLRALGRDFDIVDVRGNVDTRLARVGPGDLDAVVLAAAGLARLGRSDAVTELIDPIQMLPAPGQGALAVEVRADRADLLAAFAPLDDPGTRASVTAERAVLAGLEAGCSAPVGALALLAEGDAAEPELFLRAVVASPDGGTLLRLSTTGSPAEAAALGHRLAAALLDEGAESLGVGVR
jgi:hydroxymethylbilane synthase